MYHSILVPLDPSQGLASSLPFAASLAKGLGARLTLLAVVSPTWRSRESSLSQTFLQGQVESLAEAGVDADSVVDSGRPGPRIIARVPESGFDLIVMGTRGRSGLPGSHLHPRSSGAGQAVDRKRGRYPDPSCRTTRAGGHLSGRRHLTAIPGAP